MSLRHALLALLTAQPMSGYDVTKVFDRSETFVWHAPHSQIYPELRRMEVEGLIAAESSQRGRHGIKRMYSVTAPGRAELRRWVCEQMPPEPIRDAQRLKSAYLEFGSLDNARRQFKAHLEHYELWERLWESHVVQLRARATPLIRKRLMRSDPSEHEAIVAYKVHAYEGLVAQARAEVAWAQEGLRMVDELEAAGHREPDVAGSAR